MSNPHLHVQAEDASIKLAYPMTYGKTETCMQVRTSIDRTTFNRFSL